MENEFGPGNLSAGSWSPGICYAMMQTQNNCKKKCSNSFFAISSQHVTVISEYSSMISNCCLSLIVSECSVSKLCSMLFWPVYI